MKTIFRNLLSVLRRFKMATTLNVLGLSVAFAAFIVIMIQLDYDRNFDRSYPDADAIYRVEVGFGNKYQGIINRPLANLFIESSPHIVAGSLVNPWGGNMFFSVEKDGVQHNFEEKTSSVYPDFPRIFSFDMVEGSADALNEPEKVLIPQSMARRLFGDEPAVDRLLKGMEDWTVTVGGVYRDLPRNSAIENVIYQKLSDKENIQNWGNWNYVFFIRVDSPENAKGLFDNFKRITDPSVMSSLGDDFGWESTTFNLRLTSLPEVHYTTDVTYDRTPKASRQTLLVLFAIAIVIIVIAGINFTNFSTALTPMRIKSINTQKVLGGDEGVIRRALLAEAILTSFVAFLIALGMIYLLPLTPVASMIEADLSLAAHPLILAGTGVIALLTGLLAGLYPALYMTS
ncbi:MAG: ABC transporter permease, partial [Tannerellaceae bacterium]|nr:ABC transporter permease [Tannerellaceae bacterium]